MYISIELIIKIALIALTVLHIVFDMWVLIKLKGLKSNGTNLTFGAFFENVKKVATSFINYVEPKFPNVIGLIKTITGGEKPTEKETQGDN